MMVLKHVPKDRSSLALTRAEKLVIVSSASQVANKDTISCEEKEMELMCTAVDESQFGNALVDCILSREPVHSTLLNYS